MGHYPRRGRAAGAALDSFAADVRRSRDRCRRDPPRARDRGLGALRAGAASAPAAVGFGRGFDLVRNPDGEFVVLEDQIRMPSGLGYALSAREVLPAALGVPRRARTCGRSWAGLETLRAIAPEGDDPTVVVLSSGPDGAGWYEHERIGREARGSGRDAGSARCGGDDELNARVNRRPRRIDVVYQRTDEDRFTDEEGEPTPLGAALLGPAGRGMSRALTRRVRNRRRQACARLR